MGISDIQRPYAQGDSDSIRKHIVHPIHGKRHIGTVCGEHFRTGCSLVRGPHLAPSPSSRMSLCVLGFHWAPPSHLPCTAPPAARQSAAVSHTLRPTACPEPPCLPQALASSFDGSADLQRRAADMKTSYRPLSHSSPPTCIFALLRRLYRPAVRHSSTTPLTHPLEE